METAFATAMAASRRSPKLARLRRLLGAEYVRFERTVRCLATIDERPASRSEIIRPPTLKFESSGYWKPLDFGEIGVDPDGRPVVGKTWTQRTDAWESSSPANFLLARSRKQPLQEQSEYVYVVRSPGHAGDIYKIGRTSREVGTRNRELSGRTETPLPFEVLASWPVRDAAQVEEKVHAELEPFRLSSRREFFKLPLPRIIETIQRVSREIDLTDT